MGHRKGGTPRPAESREEALRYVKRLIKRKLTPKQTSLSEFSAALLEDRKLTRDAFQQLIFSCCEEYRTVSDMEQCLTRYRTLFTATTPYESAHFFLAGRLSAAVPRADGSPELFSTAEAASLLLEMLITDLYLYLSRFFNTQQSMLNSLKLLRTEYTKELQWMCKLEKKCRKVFGKKENLTAAEFRRVIEYQKEFSDKIFNKFDRSKSGTLNIHELYDGLVGILTADTAGRLKYLFDIYDTNGDGILSREEVDAVLRMCVSESRLELHDELTDELTSVLWGRVTGWQREGISFDEFYATLRGYPAVYDNLSVNVIGTESLDGMFRFLEKKRNGGAVAESAQKTRQRCQRFGMWFIRNRTLWFMTFLYVSVSAALLAERVCRLVPRPFYEWWFVVAKCAGQLLNFNITFSLLLTLKHIFTRLRKVVGLRRLLPFDDAQFLHKLVAYVICFLTVVHVAAHAGLIVAKITLLEGMSHYYFMEGDACIVFWSGVGLIVVLFTFLITSLASIKEYSYELFIRSHQVAALLWLVGMALHGVNFWKWLVGPLVLLCGERVAFLLRLFLNRTRVKTGIAHDNITQLTIKRPRYFKFSPGDYVNVNIPHISKNQWHPFTISSSPHQDADCFTLHIRKVGRWTGKLHAAVTKESDGQKDFANSGFETHEEQGSPGLVIKFPQRDKTPVSDEPATDPPAKPDRTDSVVIDMEVKDESHAPVGDAENNNDSTAGQRSHSAIGGGNGNSHGLTLPLTLPLPIVAIPEDEVLDAASDDSCPTSPEMSHLSAAPATLTVCSSPLSANSRSVSPRIFMSQASKDAKVITPVEKRVLWQSTGTLDSGVESRRSSVATLRKSRSLSIFSRESSRSSIIPIREDRSVPLDWQVYLDGPFSTPSHAVLNTKHAVLVAGGIGITPFLSVLESIICLLKNESKCNKDCDCSKSAQQPALCPKQTSLRRIDFVWVTRDQSHLSWFHQVFNEIESAQSALGLDPPLVNLHIYLTGLKRSEDIRGTFLQLALEMIYQEDSIDVLSGLKAKTKAGRPNWSELLKSIMGAGDVEKKSKPKVFACGPGSLCDQLKKECYKLDIAFKEEVF